MNNIVHSYPLNDTHQICSVVDKPNDHLALVITKDNEPVYKYATNICYTSVRLCFPIISSSMKCTSYGIIKAIGHQQYLVVYSILENDGEYTIVCTIDRKTDTDTSLHSDWTNVASSHMSLAYMCTTLPCPYLLKLTYRNDREEPLTTRTFYDARSSIISIRDHDEFNKFMTLTEVYNNNERGNICKL